MDCAQLRAGRALLRWTQAELSEKSGVSIATIKKLEQLDGEVRANVSTIRSLERALVDGGVVLLEPGDTVGGGYGVRLKDAP